MREGALNACVDETQKRVDEAIAANNKGAQRQAQIHVSFF